MSAVGREGFTVRVLRRGSGASAGVGFVVGDRHIITCAHVINTALDRQQRSQDKPGPGDRVEVEFPMLGDADGGPLRSCRVLAWAPPPLSGLSGGDIAGLTLVGEGMPEGAGSARLIHSATLRDVAVYVFGYPGDPPRPKTGAWAAHWLRGAVGGGILQLDVASQSAIRTQPGYSGSPAVVSVDAGDGVVGMLAVAGNDEEVRDVYAIPVSRLIEVWSSSPDGPSLKISAGADAVSDSQDIRDDAEPIGSALISVSRRAGQLRDRMTGWTVLIDDRSVGRLRPGESDEYAVTPGAHQVQMKVDSLLGDYRSPAQEVTLRAGERVRFICDAHHAMTSFAAWKKELAAPKDTYIKLEHD